jgi:hypothetical protein
MASLKRKTGPPLRAVNRCPESSNSTVMMEPEGMPWISRPASP